MSKNTFKIFLWGRQVNRTFSLRQLWILVYPPKANQKAEKMVAAHRLMPRELTAST